MSQQDMDLLLWLHAEAVWLRDRDARELARWRSGQRRRSWPSVTAVPDGLAYAAALARAQGTEGGDEHDELLRQAAIRLRDMDDAARAALVNLDRSEASRRDWAAEAARLDYELSEEKKRRATESLVYDRYCCWPGCFRSFSVLTGPTDNEPSRRWIQINAASTFVFCPDHEHTGHRPQKFHWEPGWKVVQMRCECGAEGNDLVPANTDSCREWWLAHAASLPLCAVHPEVAPRATAVPVDPQQLPLFDLPEEKP